MSPNTISTISFFTISINLHCTFWTKHCFLLFAMEITLVDGWCYCYFEALFTLATLRIWKFEILNVNSSELLCVPFQHCSRFKFIAWINSQRRMIQNGFPWIHIVRQSVSHLFILLFPFILSFTLTSRAMSLKQCNMKQFIIYFQAFFELNIPWCTFFA